jgi:hypothetical protein
MLGCDRSQSISCAWMGVNDFRRSLRLTLYTDPGAGASRKMRLMRPGLAAAERGR